MRRRQKPTTESALRELRRWSAPEDKCTEFEVQELPAIQSERDRRRGIVVGNINRGVVVNEGGHEYQTLGMRDQADVNNTMVLCRNITTEKVRGIGVFLLIAKNPQLLEPSTVQQESISRAA